jgi:hypothetical protein
VRRNIALLATFQEARGAASGPTARKCFGNILELGTRGMILEADRELPEGAPITVTVVFPGQIRTPGGDPASRLRCRVRKHSDADKLHYDVAIVHMDDVSRERLNGYLQRGASLAGA